MAPDSIGMRIAKNTGEQYENTDRADRDIHINPIPVRRNDENDELSNGHSPALYGARHSRPEQGVQPGSYDEVKKHAGAIYDSVAENRDVRPGAVRSDDGAIPA